MKVRVPFHVTAPTREGNERKFHTRTGKSRNGHRFERTYRFDAMVEVPDVSASEAPVGIRVTGTGGGGATYGRRVWNGGSWGLGFDVDPVGAYDFLRRGTGGFGIDGRAWPWAEPTDFRPDPIPTVDEAGVVAFEDDRIVERTEADVLERAPTALLVVEGRLLVRRPPPLYDLRERSPVRVVEDAVDAPSWSVPVHPTQREWIEGRAARVAATIEVTDPSPYVGAWSVEGVHRRALVSTLEKVGGMVQRFSPERRVGALSPLAARCEAIVDGLEGGEDVDPAPTLREAMEALSPDNPLRERAGAVLEMVRRRSTLPALDVLTPGF